MVLFWPCQTKELGVARAERRVIKARVLLAPSIRFVESLHRFKLSASDKLTLYGHQLLKIYICGFRNAKLSDLCRCLFAKSSYESNV